MISIHWFRRDLRLHDNAALAASLVGAAACIPVYVLEPRDVDPTRASPNRVAFLRASLLDLDASLRRVGSRLTVLRGAPADVLPPLVRSRRATRLTFEKHTEPHAIDAAAAITAALARDGVDVRGVHGHTLWDPDVLLSLCPGRRPPIAYKSFCKLVGAQPPPPLPAPAPEHIPSDGAGDGEAAADVLADLAAGGAASGASLAAFPGGETEALKRLRDSVVSRATWVSRFQKPETPPTALTPSTTALSPYLSHGCLSARKFYHAVETASRAGAALGGGGRTQPPVSLDGQLIWRDFYHLSAAGTPAYARMAGNAVCKQIDWRSDPAAVAAWAESRTGYPWIDAVMAQLRAEGWVHHLARHAAACFLTRGDLYQSWEAGAAVFERELLDWDWALNAGNWMWLSASAYFYRFTHVYSLVEGRGGGAGAGLARPPPPL